MKLTTATLLLAAWTPLLAQGIKLPANLEKLSSKAEESVEVTLDSNMLKLMAMFDKGGDDQKWLLGLDSVYVRSFQFAFHDQYQMADVEALRAQLQAPGWSRIVGVRSKMSDGDVDVYFKDGGGGKLAGIVVIAAEPREFTFVSLTGTLDPGQLAGLGGHFHIPALDLAIRGSSRKDWKEWK